jgi:hypothetical protein
MFPHFQVLRVQLRHMDIVEIFIVPPRHGFILMVYVERCQQGFPDKVHLSHESVRCLVHIVANLKKAESPI